MSKERHSQNKHPCKMEHLFPRNTLLWGRYLTWSVFYIRYKIIVFRFFLQYPGQAQIVWKEKKKRSSILTREMLIRVGILFFKMACLLQRKCFLANALHVQRSLYWLIRMSANLANALIWLTYVSVFLLVLYVYEITIGPLLLAIRWHVMFLSIYGNMFMAKGTTWVLKIFL